ncbi:MAG: hypothetical protein HY888_08480 [Deltaproteobacteria bacterium]|nr:hypothetical protein [Deltaproteobacteria bacterium]
MDIEKLNKFITKRDSLAEKGADYLKEKVIGVHVAAIVSETGELSLPRLIAALKLTADSVQNSERLKAETALKYLLSLQGDSAPR